MRGRRLLKGLTKRTKTNRDRSHSAPQESSRNSQPQRLYPGLRQNEDQLRSLYDNCADVIYRSFLIGGKTQALVMYIDGLADSEGIERFVIAPLMLAEADDNKDLRQLIDRKISASQVKEFTTFEKGVELLVNGNAILLCDNQDAGIGLGLTKWEKRSIEEPSAEVGIRGPRQGFTESLRTNTSQLRRIIKTPLLKMEETKIGEYTQTNIILAYIEGLADETLIKEVRTRLRRIEIDGVLESGYIEEMIEDQPYSPFPQLLSTERPDVVCSSLLEGKVAILTEGTPFTLIAPTTFFSLIQSQEDYYQRYLISTVIRWLRYAFIVISLVLPSVYVAVLTFHQEMVPGALLISMASSREQVPFPALIEALLMEITFEALREAGVRLPKQVGAAVSIVGALVIGQAAVQAGLVSAPMVIVVAITGISSFMVPRYIAGISVRMLRFPLIFLAGSLGLVGVVMGIIAVVLHMLSLRSFGVPYLSEVAAPHPNEWKDVLVRAPRWKMNTRPRFTGKYDKYRQSSGQRPGPIRGDDAE
ncbi:MAG: spore germination protein [Paenibacillus macerans]|uniref:GerA spore germination family protein n=1 Tax=Paenibacillus macerans TaxID=44252 RepID=A0A090ZPS2_PAEMA|nr:spore germination protein [Paenibacillus macerans]KFN12275.1 GerA spore germination family protein [Paenibacillus macerans]MBS5915041.1 spore germination protein [Paenibacillus macerans]MCY7558732.1 spore germination protein [Paenibacillus macerans]MDU7476002.1 spore germination protein [Paenibacillus macerans]MEC0140558.1 spore germination protein [Paenibacillus macerans]